MADPFSIETWRRMFTRHGQKVVYGLTGIFGLSLVISFGMGRYGTGGGGQTGNPQNPTIATVNGMPITQTDYQGAQQMMQRRLGGTSAGASYALAQGEIIRTLIASKVAEQEAKKANVRASDADIDREIQQERDSVLPKGASDSDWEDYLNRTHQMTPEEYRDYVGKQLLAPALLKSYEDAEKVTDEEARNQTAEVKLDMVSVPVGPAPGAKNQKSLTDAEAKKKAEDLLAKAKAGADLKALIKANNAQGGDQGWRPEYKSMPNLPPDFGVLFAGKDFDAAVHKTPPGQFTDVVKTTGFMPGYAFAKVVDRRNNLPKDFNAGQVAQQLKQQRAAQKLNEDIQAKVKTANVVFTDPDKKTYYDYFQQMMTQQGGPSAASPADAAKQQALVDSEIEALQKRSPTDPTADLLYAEVLKRKEFAKGTTPQQRDQMRDQIITLYEDALKSTEDRSVRFELAGLYREKKDNAKAEAQYDEIARLLAADPPYDLNTMKQDIDVEKQLIAGYNSIGKPDKAKTEQNNLVKIEVQQTEETKKQQAAQKAAGGSAGAMNLAPGAGGTMNVTVPASGGAAPSSPPLAPAASAPKPAEAPTSKSAAPSTAVPTKPAASAPAPSAGGTTKAPAASTPAGTPK